MRVNGSCHCGDIVFEADVDPADVNICHCTDCQTLTGTVFRVSVRANAEDFTLLAGKPAIYVKTADSGAHRAQGFCGRCGTPLYATSADRQPAAYGIRVGTLAQRKTLEPTHEVWRASALPWVPEFPQMTSWAQEDD